MDSLRVKVGKKLMICGTKHRYKTQAPPAGNASSQPVTRKRSPRMKPGIGKPSHSK